MFANMTTMTAAAVKTRGLRKLQRRKCLLPRLTHIHHLFSPLMHILSFEQTHSAALCRRDREGETEWTDTAAAADISTKATSTGTAQEGKHDATSEPHARDKQHSGQGGCGRDEHTGEPAEPARLFSVWVLLQLQRPGVKNHKLRQPLFLICV